jgi:hypothetical protein
MKKIVRKKKLALYFGMEGVSVLQNTFFSNISSWKVRLSVIYLLHYVETYMWKSCIRLTSQIFLHCWIKGVLAKVVTIATMCQTSSYMTRLVKQQSLWKKPCQIQTTGPTALQHQPIHFSWYHLSCERQLFRFVEARLSFVQLVSYP